LWKALCAWCPHQVPSFFDGGFLESAAALAEPRRYRRKITPAALFLAFMDAFLLRLPGLRAVAGHSEKLLGTANHSALSHALCRASGVGFLRLLLARLEGRGGYRRGELVALDSMAVTLASRLRHRCEAVSDRAAGGGVLWAYRVAAPPGECPVRLLKTVRGAWHDSKLIGQVALEARGAIYLMDRGFYRIEQVGAWLTEGARFIVRVRSKDLCYDIVKKLGRPRRPTKTKWRIVLDARVVLGSPARRKPRPVVRLVRAISGSGERFDFVTSEQGSAQQILDHYRKRWHIERFHRFLKESLALAHLYSFDATGIEFLLLTVLLCAMLLAMEEAGPPGETITRLHDALRRLRQALGLGPTWRRNTIAPTRKKRRPPATNHSPNL